MLQNLELQNFMGASHCYLDGFNQINLFVGRHGSGKSTVLDALYTLKTMSQSAQGLQPPLERITQRKTSRTPDGRDLFYNYHHNEEARITTTFDKERWVLRLGDDDAIPDLRGNSPLKMHIQGSSSGQSFDFQLNIAWNLEVQRRTGSGSSEPPFAVKSYLDHLTLIDKIFTNSPYMIEEFLNDIKDDRRDAQYISFINEIYPDLTSYEFARYSPRMRGDSRVAFNFPQSRVYWDQLADGLREGLTLLTTAYSLEGTALLIEELENAQYPESLGNLISKLTELVFSNELQLFVTTHRPEVLYNFARFGEDSVTIFHMNRDAEGSITSYKSSWYSLEILLDIGSDIGDIVNNTQKFVTVEGITDKLFLEHAITRVTGFTPSDALVSVVNSRGKKGRNLKELIKALVVSGKRVIPAPDLDDNSKEDSISSVIDSIRSLTGQGYEEVENDDGGASLVLLGPDSHPDIHFESDMIIPLGNPNRFPDFARWTVDDYILEILLENQNLLDTYHVDAVQIANDLGNYKSSKDVLVRHVNYTPDFIVDVLQNADSIPESVNELIRQITQQ